MRIISIEARAFDRGFSKQKLQTSQIASPMSRFSKFAENRASWMWPSKKVFVRIETDDGIVGWSCTNGGEVVALIINQHLSRLIEGEECHDIEDIWEKMFFSLLQIDRSGFAMMAVAGVDIALWDLKTKSKNISLYRLLGGTNSATLPVYATTSQVDLLRGGGWWGLKAAIPYGPESGDIGLAKNVDYMRQYRKVAGPDTPIMLDAFMAWDAEYTLRFADAAKDLDINWIEDPIPPYDLEGIRRIKSELDSPVKLALGNFAFSRWDCTELLRESLVDILQPDVAWAGGITEGLKILDLAAKDNVPVILHNTCEQPWALAMAAACQKGAVVEYVDRIEGSPLYSLMGERVQIKNGQVQVPDNPTGNHPPQDVQCQFSAGSGAAKIKGR